MSKRWLTAGLILGLAALAGCDDGEDVERQRLFASVRGLMTGWAREDPALLQQFISDRYAFDEQNKADHIAAIVADFPDIRNLRVVNQNLEIITPDLASVQVEFAAELFADIAALDYPVSILAWVPSRNLLDQVWLKDFDGVWRLGAQYLQGSWVVADTPVITHFTVQPGDRIAPGDTGAFSAIASAARDSHRVTLFPSSDAAAFFDPDFAFGFGAAFYSGAVTIRSDALGEYSFAMIGQTDLVGQPQMLGRLLRAVFIIVSQREGRAIIGGKTVPGNTQSIFRHLRIRRAAGHYPQPRPGAGT